MRARLNLGALARGLVGVGAALALAACGDDDAGGSGLDPDKTIADLTADEARLLCDRFETRVSDVGDLLVGLLCTADALVAAAEDPEGTVASCEVDAAACIEAAPPAESTLTCAVDDALERADCEVTVAEIETCFDDLFTEIEALAEVVSCELLDDPEPEVPELDLPASCQALEARCPALGEEEDV